MTIGHYLQVHSETNSRLAKRLGVSTSAVSRYRHGTRIPRPGVMARVVAATGGLVRPEDFYRDGAGNTKARRSADSQIVSDL